MKHKYLTFMLFILMSWAASVTLAYDAYIDGVYYYLNSSAETATVTYYSSSSSSNASAYSGGVFIPEAVTYNGKTYSVTAIRVAAFSGCSGLTSITIPNSVTSIDGTAFSGCTALKTVTINSNAIASKPYMSSFTLGSIFGAQVTNYTFGESVKQIGNYACYNLSNITMLNLPEGVTAISQYAFYGCSGLTSVTIPNSVTSIGRAAFQGCSSLTSIEIPNSVTSISDGAFSRCSGLTCVTINSNAVASKTYTSSSCLSAKFGSQVTNYSFGQGVEKIGDYACYNLSNITVLSLPESVTSIGSYTFGGCLGLTSIEIPSSVTSIGDGAFRNCSGLTCVTINSNAVASKTYTSSSCLSEIFGSQVTNYSFGQGVEKIGDYACYKLSNITMLNLPEGVTAIGLYAFYGCSGLTSIAIPNSVNEIGGSAFSGCSGLTSIEIPKSVTLIGSSAFQSCTGLTKAGFSSIEHYLKGISFSGGFDSNSNPLHKAHHLYVGGSEVTNLVIPNTVTSIGSSAFSGCTGLTSIEIPNSVTSIGENAFSGCSGLTKAEFSSIKHYLDGISFSGGFGSYSNPLYGAHHLYVDGSEVTNLVIPNTMSNIGSSAFSGCLGLVSVTIPNSVNEVGSSAFSGCLGLTSIEIPNSVNVIGSSAFYDCTSLTSVTINSNAVASKTYTSSSCLSEIFGSQVTSYTFGEGVEKIGDYACYNSSKITVLNLPASLTTIEQYAFSRCMGLTGCDLPDGIVSVGQSAFPTSAALNVNRGTTSLLALWNANYKQPYEKGTENVLTASTLKLDGITQMTGTVRVNDFYPEYENTLNDNIIDVPVNVFTSRPNKSNTVTLRVMKGGVTYTAPYLTYTTLPISPTAARAQGTASSMAVKASYLEGDAEVTSQTLTVNGVTVEGDSLYLNGLKPNTTYKATYTIMVNNEYEYTKTVDLKTDAMSFVNEQPKVISEGNVIIGATSNLDWDETNVGFQWRRTDWTDDFASNEAGAYQFEGKIEGYIRNMNTTYLWRFRPYYEAADGTRSYGDWLGIDPTNTSYFEPTVHTYANIMVDGNSAEVKGYAQRGTDNVVSQGFVYWKASTTSTTSPQPSPKAREKAPAIPSGAQKVEASGTVMEANLTNLDYETTYKYVAYVTTSEGETFYGEEKMFTTGEYPTDIENVNNNLNANENGVYDLSGRRINANDNENLNQLKKGIYIVNGRKLLKR